MSDLLGSAVLELSGDLLPLDAALADAKSRTAISLATMQAMADAASHDMGKTWGEMAKQIDQGLSAPFARFGAAMLAMDGEIAQSMGVIRTEASATARVLDEVALKSVATQEALAAAVDHTADAYLREAAAAKIASDVSGEGFAAESAVIPSGNAESVRDVSLTAAAIEAMERKLGDLHSGVKASMEVGNVWGVRGPQHPGSISNPIVIVMEAARFTGMGSMAAAIGENSATTGDTTTTTVASGGGSTRTLITEDQKSSERILDTLASKSTTTNASSTTIVGGKGSQAPNSTSSTSDLAALEVMEAFRTATNRVEARQSGASVLASAAGAAAGHSASSSGLLGPATGVAAGRAGGGGGGKGIDLGLLLAARNKELRPGQWASEALADLYAARSYVAARAPDGSLRLYGVGGKPGSREYGASPLATAAGSAAGSRAGGGGGGKGIDLGLLLAARNKELRPGQWASEALADLYAARSYVAARAPDGSLRLYGVGGKPGSREYGASPLATAAGSAAGSRAGGGGGGKGIDLGLLLTGHAGGGGGHGPGFFHAGLLGGLVGLGAGFGSLASFAGAGTEHIIITAGSIAGSGVSALGGAGLLGLGSLGKLVAGEGADLAVGSSATADTTTLYTGYEKLREAVEQYGRSSKQAKEAQQELDATMKYNLSGTKGVEAELHLAERISQLNVNWDKGTSTARIAFAQMAEPVIELAEKWIPLVNTAAQSNFEASKHAMQPLMSWLKGPEGMGIFQQLEEEFHSEIPLGMHALTEGFKFFGDTVSYLAPLTGKFLQSLNAFFTRWEEPANFVKWEGEMGRLIGDFHTWLLFVEALGGAVVDLFTHDAHTGSTIIETLTVMLDKLREWEKSTQGGEELHNLFTVHREEVVALLKLLPELISGFGSIYLKIAPPLVSVVTTVLHGIDALVEGLERLGPAGDWIVGLTLLAAKLHLLVPAFDAIKGSLGFGGGATATTSADTIAAGGQRAADAITAGAEKAAEALAAAGESVAKAMGSAGAKTSADLSAGGEKAAEEIAGGGELAGSTATAEVGGAGVLGGFSKNSLIKGGVFSTLGALGANQIADLAGAKGTLNSAITAGGAGAGAGFVLGPAAAALLGTEIAPGIGTAIGAAIGFAAPFIVKGLGSIFDSQGPKWGEKLGRSMAETFPLGFELKKQVEKEVAEAVASYEGANKRVAEARELVKSPLPALRDVGKAELKAALAQSEAAARQDAAAYTKIWAARIGEVPDLTPASFLRHAESSLASLPVKMREAVAQAMIGAAGEFEAKQDLPEGALEYVVRGLESKISGLGSYLSEHAGNPVGALAKAMGAAQSQLQEQLTIAQTQYGAFGFKTEAVGKELVASGHSAARQLSEDWITGSETTKAAVLPVWEKIVFATEHVQELLRKSEQVSHSKALRELGSFGREYAHLTRMGLGEAEGFWTAYWKSVEEKEEHGTITLREGLVEFNKILSGELTRLGVSNPAIAHALTPGATTNLTENPLTGKSSKPAAGAGVLAPGKAKGSWIGRPGEHGSDEVPIWAGRGEAIVNRHQQPEVERGLAVSQALGLGRYGSLSELFSGVQTPHYMASGGIVPPRVSGSGAFPTMDRAALAMVASGVNHSLGALAATYPGVSSGGSNAANEALGRAMMIARGIPASEWPYLQELWAQESSWSDYAVNPQSGAKGIAQSLGHGPVPLGNAAAQIAWGLGYILERYGSPANAWAHEEREGWYAKGGQIKRGHGGPKVADSYPQKVTKGPANRKPKKVRPVALFNSNLSELNASFGGLEGIIGEHGSITTLQELFEATNTADKANLPSSWIVTEKTTAEREADRSAEPTLKSALKTDQNAKEPPYPAIASLEEELAILESSMLQEPYILGERGEWGVKQRIGQLDELLTWQEQVQVKLEEALGITNPLETTLLQAIARRKARIAKLKEKIKELTAAYAAKKKKIKEEIRANLQQLVKYEKEIKALEKELEAAENPKVDQKTVRAIETELRTAQDAKKPDKATIGQLKEKLHIAEYPEADKATIKTLKGGISADTGHVKELHEQNRRLGGKPSEPGEGGEIAVLKKVLAQTLKPLEAEIPQLEEQDSELQTHVEAVKADRYSILGAGGAGLGGTLGSTKTTIGELRKELAELEGPLGEQVSSARANAKAEVAKEVQNGPEATTETETESELATLLKEQNERLAQQLAVSQAQYGVLSHLPPFGGSFALGGTVPGPLGAATMIMAHGGERVTPLGAAGHVKVIVEDGAVDPQKIAVIADAVTTQNTREVGRKVGRRLPSSGGGHWI